jgi:hypothetical protein
MSALRSIRLFETRTRLLKNISVKMEQGGGSDAKRLWRFWVGGMLIVEGQIPLTGGGGAKFPHPQIKYSG